MNMVEAAKMPKKTKVPKKYTEGLSSSAASRRKAAIRARAKSPVYDYSPLPGDKTASGKQRKTKESQHTKAYRKKFGGKGATKK